MANRFSALIQTLKANRARIYKCTVTAGILAYAWAVLLWMIPDNPSRNRLIQPLRPIVMYLGLWQSFVVFSPNPRPYNLSVTAEIKYDDGSVSTWHYPRMDQLSYFDRIQKERYRKYGLEHLAADKDKYLRPDFARYLARMHATPGKHPVEISLIRHWVQILPPAQGMGKQLAPHLRHYTFFTYKVKEGDLV